MHIISEKKLREFWKLHPGAETALQAFCKNVEKATWRKFADVREMYPRADRVGTLLVFDIGGNKYRIIAAVHYDRGKFYVRHILTHADYDKGDWKTG